MCRIAGIVDLSHKLDLSSSITAMRYSMRRGGPDDSGDLVNEEKRLAFGFCRLALLDLSPAGHQPMQYFDVENTIIFNGEIYNFLEIRAGLKAKGYQFKSNSDTEVILAAYHAYGTECFAKFNGMFALAIWDKAKNKIILARDHAGIKPLYYHLSATQLIFASEIRAFKALKPDWPENENWRIPFLTFGHLPEPFTTLSQVTPLQKGSYLQLDLSSLKFTHTVFNKFEFSSTVTNLQEAVSLVKGKLDKAVKRHLISDAPIGLFLSGGVDSSLLTLIANKYIGDNLKTLSIVFEDASLNEAPYQQMIVDRTNAKHHSFLVTEKEFEEEFDDVLEAMDQPSIDGVNTYFISKYARRYGLTAVLSGLGADELFGGYPSFNRTEQVAQMQKLPAAMLGLSEFYPKDKIRRIAFAKRKDLIGDFLLSRGISTPHQVARLLQISTTEVEEVLNKVYIDPLPASADKRNKVSWTETNLYMQNQLLKDSDCMSMWHGLEIRVPFLDKELMQAAFSIAPDVKFDKVVGKHLLIKAFDDVLPKEIWQRKKQGFTFPFYKWMQHVNVNSDESIYKKLKDQYRSNKIHWSRFWCYVLSITNKKISYNHQQAKSILFLSLYSFSITGGIEKFNRAFLKSLSELEAEGSVSANSISLYDRSIDEKYFSADNYIASSGSKFSFMGQLIKAASQYDTIIVGHLNLAMPAMLIKKLYPSKKMVVIIHGIEVWDEVKGSKKQLLDNADFILAVSNFTASKLVDVQKVDSKKIKLFHNTLDPFFELPGAFEKPQYLKKRYNILNGEKIVYTMTRMSSREKYKGYDKVIEALPSLVKKYPGIKYIIGGKADEAEKIRVENMVKEKHLQDHVILSGFIEDEEVVDHFQLADVFIMPSSGEGFGIVFIEAMACGLPVIGGNIDGTVDALQNGKLGKLVNPADAKAIAKAIDEQLNGGRTISGKELQNAMLEKFAYPKYKNRLKEILV